MRFSMLRSIRTTNEKRACSTATEQGVAVRGRRNAGNLPDAYDDIFIRRQKSWKKLRKLKYHVVQA